MNVKKCDMEEALTFKHVDLQKNAKGMNQYGIPNNSNITQQGDTDEQQQNTIKKHWQVRMAREVPNGRQRTPTKCIYGHWQTPIEHTKGQQWTPREHNKGAMVSINRVQQTL